MYIIKVSSILAAEWFYRRCHKTFTRVTIVKTLEISMKIGNIRKLFSNNTIYNREYF